MQLLKNGPINSGFKLVYTYILFKLHILLKILDFDPAHVCCVCYFEFPEIPQIDFAARFCPFKIKITNMNYTHTF